MNLDFTPGQPAAEADHSLKHALATEEKACKCAVLWFAEIFERKLYRELGNSSMQQYARLALGFSETRTGDFMRLARKLKKLPAVKAALPEIGYTKAREIIKVASPRTELAWIDRARSHSRRELAVQVKRVMNKARQPAAALFDPAKPIAGPSSTNPPSTSPSHPEEVPVRVGVEFTPEQFARWEMLMEKLQKMGVSGDRAEILIDALAGKLEEVTSNSTVGSANTTPRGAVPLMQVHIHQCPDCGRTEVGGRPLSRADRERIACDAAVSVPGRRNTTTIPPRTRRQVLARDRHKCTAPGCNHTRFLEVHHLKSRSQGGPNEPDNLMTLCSACHRLWHEKGGCPGIAEERPKQTG